SFWEHFPRSFIIRLEAVRVRARDFGDVGILFPFSSKVDYDRHSRSFLCSKRFRHRGGSPMLSRRSWLPVLITLVAAAALAGILFAQQAPAGKKVAFLVGINEYEKPGFDTLRYAERDAESLKVELDKLGFRTVLLKGSAQNADQRATRENIERELKSLIGEL